MAAILSNSVPDLADGKNAFGSWHQHSVLVVDDEPGMRNFLTRALSARCEIVDAAATVEDAVRLVEQRPYDLMVLDIAMPGKSGVAWLHELRATGYQGDVILITAYADLETAIGALRGGASDFILKPFRIDQILNAIGRCFDQTRLKRENFLLKRQIAGGAASEPDHPGLVGDSRALRDIRTLIKRLAPLPSTVLITGASGTGKEVAARALHNLSPRAGGPFVPINCGAIAPELIESELFGHLKGAFTGAAGSRDGLFFFAQGGTLFLDEVGELPLAMQTKLLRVLEEKKVRPVGSEREIPVDVRVISATNRDLSEAVKQGRFRQDLYYRLDVMHIQIPPLCERSEDVEPLARHFMHQLAGLLGMPELPLPAHLLEKMRLYPWPGNVRELRNLIERALILGQFPMTCIGVETPAQDAGSAPEAGGESMEAVERHHILKVLANCQGNKSEAARRLGLSRKTLERKCAEWGV
jgi:DNA-binding NtrC family response regulator